jgi:acetyl esterase/lipase
MIKKTFTLQFFLYLLFSVAFVSCNSSSESPIADPNLALDIFDEFYGTETENTMDIFLPAGRTQATTPLIIYIHGGGWISGDKTEFSEFRPIMENSFPGYAFISVNYRLLNIGTQSGLFPDQENDIIQAINYIVSKTSEWNISNDIVLAGASAGGHLALLHSYKHQEIGNIKAVMALFPITDLNTFYDYSTGSKLLLENLLEGSSASQKNLYLESSPLNYVSSSSIPTVFFHGTNDMVVPISQSETLEVKLKENGISNYFEAIQGEGHGFQPSTYPVVIQKAADFINNEL